MQDDGALSPSADKEWAAALLKIKQRDPSIYDASTRLFTDPAPSSPDASGKAPDRKARSKKTLRQVLYEQAVEGQGGQGEDDTELDRKARLREERADTIAYDAEQRSLRSSLVRSMHGNANGREGSADDAGSDSDGDDGLVLKRGAVAAAPVCFCACMWRVRC